MSRIKKILLAILIVFIVIQFIQPARNKNGQVIATDISKMVSLPQDVQAILKTACYDCHSNNTKYPWYFNIQPAAWWLDNHIREGKEELNFSEFGTYSLARQYHKLEEVKKQVDENEMPLGSYTIIHTDAKLTDAENKTLTNWTEGIRAEIKNKYPADSLIMKKGPRPPGE